MLYMCYRFQLLSEGPKRSGTLKRELLSTCFTFHCLDELGVICLAVKVNKKAFTFVSFPHFSGGSRTEAGKVNGLPRRRYILPAVRARSTESDLLY